MVSVKWVTQRLPFQLLQHQDVGEGIGLLSRMFANGPGDWGSITGRHIEDLFKKKKKKKKGT